MRRVSILLASTVLAGVAPAGCGGSTLQPGGQAGAGGQTGTCTTTVRGRYLAASIRVSQSTNSSEIDVVVYSDGSAERTLGPSNPNGTTSGDPTPKSYPADSPEVDAFLRDLAAAGAVAQIATTDTCVKSVSFGTETTLTADGATSGDLQCLADTASPAAMALARDCDVLTGRQN
jgi:hypothetical protein